MNIIGLTGGTGSGKSLVSSILRKRGILVIDCDKIAHDIIETGMPAYNELTAEFGEGILNAEGGIERRRLAEIVFSDEKKLAFLNACTHRYICGEIYGILEDASVSGVKTAVIDAPLLIEAGLHKDCSEVWVVYADEQTRIKRIMERDNITFNQARNRMLSQKPWNEYKSFADKIIYNTGGPEALEAEIERIFENIEGEG